MATLFEVWITNNKLLWKKAPGFVDTEVYCGPFIPRWKWVQWLLNLLTASMFDGATKQELLRRIAQLERELDIANDSLSEGANKRLCNCIFETEMMGQVPEGSFCPFCLRRRYESVINEIAQLEAEIDIDNKLLDERERVLKEIPECPIHGFCLPHYREWIRKMISVASRDEAKEVAQLEERIAQLEEELVEKGKNIAKPDEENMVIYNFARTVRAIEKLVERMFLVGAADKFLAKMEAEDDT